MENISSEDNTSLLETAGKDQFQSVSNWSRFNGVTFIIFGSILLFSIVLLLSSFDALLTEVVKVNGIDEETIDMLEKGGKYFIAFALFLSGIILLINGILLYRFGSTGKRYLHDSDEATITASLEYLKKYIYFSFILATVSAVISLISTFVFFGGSH
jgi:small-conductance mechanosensitive channel